MCLSTLRKSHLSLKKKSMSYGNELGPHVAKTDFMFNCSSSFKPKVTTAVSRYKYKKYALHNYSLLMYFSNHLFDRFCCLSPTMSQLHRFIEHFSVAGEQEVERREKEREGTLIIQRAVERRIFLLTQLPLNNSPSTHAHTQSRTQGQKITHTQMLWWY